MEHRTRGARARRAAVEGLRRRLGRGGRDGDHDRAARALAQAQRPVGGAVVGGGAMADGAGGDWGVDGGDGAGDRGSAG